MELRSIIISILILCQASTAIAQHFVDSLATMQGEEILAYGYQGIEYALSGNYEKAIPIIEDFICVGRRYLPERVVARAKFSQLLGGMYVEIGEYNKAEALYVTTIDELSIDIYHNEPVYREILTGLAALYYTLHNYVKANDCINKAKSLYEECLDFGDGYVKCISNMAVIEEELGFTEMAKMCIDSAVNQARTNFEESTKMIGALSTIDTSAGQSVDVDELNQRSEIQIRVYIFISSLTNASCIYYDLGNIAKATQYAQEAVNICEGYDVAYAIVYNNVGYLQLCASRLDEAIENFNKAYKCVKNPYEYDEIALNLAIAKFFSSSTDTDSFAADISHNIRQHISDAFDFMSAEERYNYWTHLDNYLPCLNLIIYDAGNEAFYGDVYDNILKCKGLLLNASTSIKEAIYSSNKAENISAYEKLLSLKAYLGTTNDPEERQDINLQIEVIDKQLTRDIASYDTYKKKSDVDWHIVQHSLAEGEIAIEFYNIPIIHKGDSVQNIYGEPRYCAVTIKKGYTSPHIIPLCQEMSLKGKSRSDVLDNDSLYLLVWEPLEQELRGVNSIYFAADRELHIVPIEYALLPTNERMNDIYNIYRLSSTRELTNRSYNDNPPYAALYGGLNYDLDIDSLVSQSRSSHNHVSKGSRTTDLSDLRYGFDYLPGTMEEVEEIGHLFDEAQVKYLSITGNAGTEESFRTLNNEINIIHLATHGFFWTNNEAEQRSYVNFLRKANDMQRLEDKALLRSGLSFTGANIGLRGDDLPDDVEDGVLTAQEIAAMNLENVNLVVLSACQSGLGEVYNDGIFGLQRSFKLAGVHTLLMSLWEVDDRATQMLMTEFYNNILSMHSKIESLRKAQQYVRSQPNYDSPYYWAGFILLDALN